MAYIFHLTAHFKNEWCASSFAGKYAGQTFVFAPLGNALRFHEVCRFLTSHRQLDGEWWADIWPVDITDSGIADDEEAWKADQFCNVIYGMLRNDRYFDYALADVEVEQFRTLEELKEELRERTDERMNFDGLVISNELHKETGSRACFETFSPTHVWIPKKPFYPLPKPTGSGVVGETEPLAPAG